MRLGFLIALCLAAGLRADSNTADGGQPSAYLKLGVGAREEAMGRMATLSPTDPYAFYYNPALLAGLERISFGSQASFLSEGRSMNYLSVARPAGVEGQRLYYGLSFTEFALSDPIEVRATDSPQPDSTITDSQYAIQLALAGWIKKSNVAVGLNLRILNETLGEASASGISGDLGLLFRATSWLDVDAVLQDLDGHINWNTGSTDSYPLVFRGAIMAHFFEDSLGVGGEFEKGAQQNLKLRAGVEWWVMPRYLALRGGVDGTQWTAGLGAKGYLWDLGWELDYSASADQIEAGDIAQRLSLTVDMAMGSAAVKAP